MIDKIADVNDAGKPEHDEGPWSYYRDSDYWSIESLEATICGGKDNMEGNEANYFLLASAPELLEALCVIKNAYENDGPVDWSIRRSFDAIAKALGQ